MTTMKPSIRAVFLALVSGVLVLSIAVGCASTADDPSGPRVQFTGEGPVHISPAASPGINDFLSADVLAFSGSDASLTEHEIMITDEDGVMVYLAAATDRAVPDVVSWDGRDSFGSFVTEGRYVLTMTVTDELGRSAKSDPVEIVVDNTAPTADVRIPYNIFSPGGDGERDILPILQSGRGAQSWTGRVFDDQRTLVRSWEWDADLTEEIEWDGRDNAGDAVDDGRYRYVLYGEDAAGNRTTVTQEEIRIDTETPAVSLAVNRRAFSPNESGFRDTVSFELRVPDDSEVVEWTFSVLDEDARTVMTESGGETIPGDLVFTGRTDDQVLPEGAYRGHWM